jgi:hypothetical protein
MISTTTINRIYGVWIAVSLGLFVYSCSAQKKYTRDEYIDTFLKYLKENNDEKIDKMIYHFSSKNDSYEDKRRSESVKKASLWINKYGLPSRDKWIFQDGGLAGTYITIPFFARKNSADSQTSMKMVFSFPVKEFSYKATDFEAIDTINDRKGKVTGPQIMAN